MNLYRATQLRKAALVAKIARTEITIDQLKRSAHLTKEAEKNLSLLRSDLAFLEGRRELARSA